MKRACPTPSGDVAVLFDLSLFLEPVADLATALLRTAMCTPVVKKGIWTLGMTCRAWRKAFNDTVRTSFFPYMDGLYAALRASFPAFKPREQDTFLEDYPWPVELLRAKAVHDTQRPDPIYGRTRFYGKPMYRAFFFLWAAHRYPGPCDAALLQQLGPLVTAHRESWARDRLLNLDINPANGGSALWTLGARHPLLTMVRVVSISLRCAEDMPLILAHGQVAEEAFCFLLLFAMLCSVSSTSNRGRAHLIIFLMAEDIKRPRPHLLPGQLPLFNWREEYLRHPY